MLDKYKKLMATSLLVILVLITSGSVLLYPEPVHAQFPGVVTIIKDIPRMIRDAIEKGLKIARDVTFRNQLNRTMNNLAYNAAVKIATGDSGQKPLFEKKFGEKILKTIKDQAAGEFTSQLLTFTSSEATCQISGRECRIKADCPWVAQTHPDEAEINKNFNDAHAADDFVPSGFSRDFTYTIFDRKQDISKDEYEIALNRGKVLEGTLAKDNCQVESTAKFAGIDLCRVSSPAVDIQIRVMASRIIAPPAPRCTFADLRNNFENLREIDTGGLVKVSALYNQKENDLFILQNIVDQQRRIEADKRAGEFLDKITNGAYKAVKSTITGETKTPAPIVQKATEESFFKSFDNFAVQTGSPIADAFGVFTNTLAAKMLQKVFDKGLTSDSEGLLNNRFFGGLRGIAAARLKFADLLKLSDIRRSDRNASYLLNELKRGCSPAEQQIGTQGIAPGAFLETRNCVIDEPFRIAIEQGLTVAEAMNLDNEPDKESLLDPARDFGVHSKGDEGSKSLVGLGCAGCDANIYSLRSILILRSYDIVPVGWEIAARYIIDVLHQPPFRQEVSFNLEKLTKAYSDPTSPFYRLVDPDWQLKAPVSVKEIRGTGERIVSSSSLRDRDTNDDGLLDNKDDPRQIIQRGSEVVDVKTCIYKDHEGNCLEFGYCTEQKPIWNVNGDLCNPLDPYDDTYNTCQAFFRASDNTPVSLLTKTTDTATCNEDNAGCRRYALNQDSNGNWIDDNTSENNIFIDSGANTCRASNAGCSQFLRLKDTGGNILPVEDPDPGAGTDNSYVEVLQKVLGQNDPNIPLPTTDSYRDIVLVEDDIYLNDKRIDCRGTEELDSTPGISLTEEAANVACRLYEPKSFSGIEIPGVVGVPVINNGTITSYGDMCPAECVGFQSYEETVNPPLYPESRFVDFIASSADTCSISQVGCTEFTNLNEVSLGGEGLEYYTQIRECTTEDDPTLKPYFTWEGDDETGFQLRSWQLVGGSPLVNGESSSGPKHTGSQPDYDRCSASVYNLPPDDPSANPDCREYIDDGLKRFYRLASRVIVGTNECQPLRRTLTDVDNNGVVDDEVDCRAGGGDPQSSGCIHFGLPDQSQSCSARALDCREYKGFGSGNVRTILSSTFESGDTDGWTMSGGGIVKSDNSVIQNGQSLKVDATQDLIHIVQGITEDQNYILNFWATGRAILTARIEDSAGNSATFASDPETLDPNWKFYSLGPAIIDFDPVGEVSLVISGWSGDPSWIDNIVLRESNDLYLIQDSWITPSVCEAPESQLNCEEYTDDKGESKFIKNFTRICEEEFVGCEAFIDIANSESALASPIFNAQNDDPNNPITLADNVVVPADTIVYYVNNEAAACQSADVGCTAVGERIEKYDSTVQFSTKYKKLLPQEYQISLCSAEAELCDEFLPVGQGIGFPQHFKDPQGRVCEYKEGVLVLGLDPAFGTGVVDGWFRIGATPVTPDDICQIGDVPNVETKKPVCNFNYTRGVYEDRNSISLTSNDPSYLGSKPGCYSYQCPAQLSSCTEFQDPLTPEACDKNLKPGEGWCGGVIGNGDPCRSDSECNAGSECVPLACDYYYILRDSLSDSIAECQGQIDRGAGCIGFYETSEKEESKDIRSDCQAGCQLTLACYDTGANQFVSGPIGCDIDSDCNTGQACRALPVTEAEGCFPDPEQTLSPDSVPGCGGF